MKGECAALPSSNELYDLEVDVAEQNNLAAKYPDRVRELEDILNRYAESSRPAQFLNAYMPYIKKDFGKAVLAYDQEDDSMDAE